MARASPSPRWYHRRRHRHLGGIAPMGQDLLEVVKDGVAVLTLNRPDRLNAMSGPMLSAMLEALPRLAGDPRVASAPARFATAFARVGYSCDIGGSWSLPQLVGTAKARELYYTADIVDAPQALTLGIVNRVVPDTRLDEETMALAGPLARGPRVAYRYMKRNFNAAESGTLKDCLDLEAWHHTRTGMTEDHKEAAKAFVEKREPTFKGR